MRHPHPPPKKRKFTTKSKLIEAVSIFFPFKVIETDDDFEPLSDAWDYLVDFRDLSFPAERPEREHSYLEVRRAPAESFRKWDR